MKHVRKYWLLNATEPTNILCKSTHTMYVGQTIKKIQDQILRQKT